MTPALYEKRVGVYLLRQGTASSRIPRDILKQRTLLKVRRNIVADRSARLLSRLVPRLSKIISSPLLGPLQTAHAMAEIYNQDEKVEVCADLVKNGRFDRVMERLRTCENDASVLMVGHDAGMEGFLSFLMWKNQLEVPLKKGGICHIDLFLDDKRSHRSHLRWFVPSQDLRSRWAA